MDHTDELQHAIEETKEYLEPEDRATDIEIIMKNQITIMKASIEAQSIKDEIRSLRNSIETFMEMLRYIR